MILLTMGIVALNYPSHDMVPWSRLRYDNLKRCWLYGAQLRRPCYPVAIFGVSKVLLPREILGRNPIVSAKPLDNAPPPDDDALSPENSSGFDGQPSQLSSPPGFREDVRSHAGGSLNFVVLLCCIGLYFVV
ncbi:hypothetical protein JHK85_040815 [Glycine max]|nr:hypothetical protein JHK85_040815 [Glycine max]